METIEERAKALKKSRADAVELADLAWVATEGRQLERAAKKEGYSLDERHNISLPGYWAEYYWYLKGGQSPCIGGYSIEKLYTLVARRHESKKKAMEAMLASGVKPELDVHEKALELIVNYGYLLAEIAANLQNDSSLANIIIGEIRRLAERTRKFHLILKTFNGEIAVALAQEEWQKAIEIARKAEDQIDH